MSIQGMQAVLPWLGPAFDLTLVALLGLVLWRLYRDAAHDPTELWREREASLREIFAGLQALVAEADGQARSLDERLAAHAAELRELFEGEAAAREAREREDVAPTPHDEPASAADAARARADEAERAEEAEEAASRVLGARIAELAEVGTPVQEIARTLGIPVAEVRLLMALGEAVHQRAPEPPAAPGRAAGSAGKILPSGAPRVGGRANRPGGVGAGQGQFYGTSIA